MTGFIFRILLLALILMMPEVIIFGQVAASEEKAPEGDAGKESYIHVPPLAVTMYHKGRPKGNMTVTVLIKLVDSEKRAVAVKYLPRLNSAYVMEASRLSHDYFDVMRPVSVAMLGDAFQLVTNKLLGHREARVLISDVIVYKK